jgi:glucose/galactose transporter
MTPEGQCNSKFEYYRAIAIVGAMFCVMGFFTWINGPLLAFVRIAFDLGEVGSFLVLMVFYISYLLWSLPSAAIHRRIGFKAGIALGLTVMATGAVIFGEFTTMRSYPGALTGLFVIGGGLALMQTAVNPYVSIIGPHERAAQRMAIMGICSKTAGIVAPLLVGTLVIGDIGALEKQLATAGVAARLALLDGYAARMEAPYLGVAMLLLVTAAVILRSPLPALRPAASETRERSSWPGFRECPQLWLGVLCLFLYMGTEVMAGDAIVAYGHALGLPVDKTKFFTSLTLAAMLAGYLAGLVCVPRFCSQQTYLGVSALLGIALVLGATVTSGYASVGFVAALGFANAMMWPAIFPLAIHGLGSRTETGAALLVMSVAGGAVIPQAYVLLKQYWSFQLVFAALMVPCYAFVSWYAWRGYRTPGRLRDPSLEYAQ